jgi:replicative DNA helicase
VAQSRPDGGPGTGASGLRAIPADHDAERAVLGALLLDHDSLYKVADLLRPESFDLPRHRVIYGACLEVSRKHQIPTLLTLRSYLEERGELEAIGGLGVLTALQDAVVTAAHIEQHADLVHRKSLARSLIRTCESIAVRGYEGAEPVSELLDDAERQVLHIGMGRSTGSLTLLQDELESTVDYIEKVQDGQIAGVRTGFEDFDKLTGGLNGGDLAILAARPSVGKSAFALNLARNHALQAGGCVCIFSLEMSRRELVLRLLLGEAQVNNERFRNGLLSERDWRAITQAATRIQDARIYLDESVAVTVGDLMARARRLNREHPLSLVIIDYIQLIQGRDSAERREQQVADISRSLKLLAKELDVPILALSQLNRGPEARPDKRPMLSDLRESGAIEQDADVVVFIYRDEVYHEDSPDVGLAEIIVSKHRNGPIGTVKLQFAKEHGRFHSLTGREPTPPERGFGSDPEPDQGFGLDSGLPFGKE